MPHNCDDFRSQARDRVDDAAELLRAQAEVECAECVRWLKRCGERIESLRILPREAAPAELDELVHAACTPGSEASWAPIERALQGLGRIEAPAALDGRVERELLPAHIRRIATLERQIAPPVLERLVREELADPAAARSRRFVGDLATPSAPEPLWRQVATEASGGLRRYWRPLAGLAAAVCLVWFTNRPGETPRQYSFEVVRVSSAASLDPMARALVEGLNGGVPTSSAGGRRR